MKYATAGAFRTALEQSLRSQATVRGIELQRLRREIVFQQFLATFEARDTHPLPDALLPASEWRPGYRKLAQEVGIGEDIASGYQIASGFLNPVLSGQVSDDARWEPENADWREP